MQKLKLILLVFGIISFLGASASAAEIELGKAPPVLEWPENLPEPVEQPGGVFLPYELERVIAARLHFLDEYPTLCQTAIDEYAGVLKVRAQADLDLSQAKHQAIVMQLEEDMSSRFAWYEVAGAVVLSGFIAFGGGYLLGAF